MVEPRFQPWSIVSKACDLTTTILPLLFRSLRVESQLKNFNVSLIISLIFSNSDNGNQLFTLFWPEGECSIMSWDTVDLFGSELGQKKMCLELVYSWKLLGLVKFSVFFALPLRKSRQTGKHFLSKGRRIHSEFSPSWLGALLARGPSLV